MVNGDLSDESQVSKTLSYKPMLKMKVYTDQRLSVGVLNSCFNYFITKGEPPLIDCLERDLE